VKRLATLIGLTVAVVLGASVPASALYADSVSLPDAGVATMTVLPPRSVDVTVTRCHPVWGVDATVTWSSSLTTRGVTGYRVMGYLNTGSAFVVTETNASTTTVTINVPRDYMNYQPRISVVTLTSYGWTAESAKSSVLAC